MKFEHFLKESVYNGIQNKAEKLAGAAKDGSLKHDNETYSLKFDQSQWVYRVTDSSGDHVINLNVKTLAKAKSDLKKWLMS